MADLAEKPSWKDSGSICKQAIQFFASDKPIGFIVILYFNANINS